MHEQKFKDLLSSTCQFSVERKVLDLESVAISMRGLGSIPTGGNIFLRIFFSIFFSILAFVAILVHFEKLY